MKRPSYPAKLKTANNMCFFGCQGAGKGYRVEQLMKPETRLFIWDSMDTFSDRMLRIDGDLHQLRNAIAKQRFRIAFVPDENKFHEQFLFCCKLVFAFGRMATVWDECDEVTRPVNPPPPWRALAGRARHAGLRNIALAHRPAEMDKKFIMNSHTVCAGRLEYKSDIEALKPRFKKRVFELEDLPDHVQLHACRGVIKTLQRNAKPTAGGVQGSLMF